MTEIVLGLRDVPSRLKIGGVQREGQGVVGVLALRVVNQSLTGVAHTDYLTCMNTTFCYFDLNLRLLAGL